MKLPMRCVFNWCNLQPRVPVEADACPFHVPLCNWSFLQKPIQLLSKSHLHVNSEIATWWEMDVVHTLWHCLWFINDWSSLEHEKESPHAEISNRKRKPGVRIRFVSVVGQRTCTQPSLISEMLTIRRYSSPAVRSLFRAIKTKLVTDATSVFHPFCLQIPVFILHKLALQVSETPLWRVLRREAPYTGSE